MVKIKTFHNLKYKVFPHERLNTSKGVIRYKDLSRATSKEIKTVLGKQGIINNKRINIWKGGKEMQTYTYIMTFNKSIIHKEMKIGYFLKRVELQN